MLGSCGASGRTDANVGAVVVGNSYRRPSFMARWGLSAYSHFTFARAHPEGNLRESCMRENRTCSLSGGRRSAWPQGLRASSDPTSGEGPLVLPLSGHRFHGRHHRLPAVSASRCCGCKTAVPQGSQRSVTSTTPGNQHRSGAPLRLGDSSSKEEGILRRRCRHRPVQYLNNILEQNHRALKRRVKAKQNFREFQAARRTIEGYEAMHMIRKGQARWVSGNDVRKQNQFIDKLFNLPA